MKLSKYNDLIFFIFTLLLHESCDFGENDEDECHFKVQSSCNNTTFSFVDPDTYENIMGYDRLVNPDSIVILNTRRDTMFHRITYWTDGWGYVGGFGPFQEITCFNQCISDSAFTRTYYMYLGTKDIDTIEVFFAERSERYTLFFNGKSGVIPDDIPPEYGQGGSEFWFLKEM